MNKFLYTLVLIFIGGALINPLMAGNPDRQGEAGAIELLMNPWAKSAGLHSMSTSFVSGIESMRINVAGLGRITKTELSFSNSQIFQGSGMSQNALGIGLKLGKSSTLGVSFTALDFGRIPVTTVNQPEGTGGEISPSFTNLGIGYAFSYQNKISVGVLFRVISESIQDVSAIGFGIDAGVQYVSGDKDNFKLGIALSNIGSPMSFGGEGLSFQGLNQDPAGGATYNLTYNARAADFELPSMLNLGISYDFYFMEDDFFIRAATNFTSNAFSRDQLGAGAEFSIYKLFVLRAAYKVDLGSSGDAVSNIYTGFAGGFSIETPIKKGGENNLGIDYAFRATNPYKGTHNFGIRYLF